jgi:hypothetical protein
MKIINGITNNQIPLVLNWWSHFSHLMNETDFISYIEYNTNFDKSLLLLDDNDNVVGGYLLGDNQIHRYVSDNSDFIGLQGIEGVLLFIEKDFRGLGWGNKLKDHPKKLMEILDIDYIWGQQYKDLNNINDWLKRRKLIDETQFIYITAEIF